MQSFEDEKTTYEA